MKGFPNYLNTAQDVHNSYALDKPRTQKILKDWVEAYFGWYITKKLNSREEGIEDAHHRIVEVQPEEEGANVELYQEFYGPLPGNAIDRRGMDYTKVYNMAGLQ